MPCFHPIKGFQALGGGLTFRKSKSNGNPMAVPCGQCIGCRTDYAKTWAIRMVHENRLHRDSTFLTLTYNPASLPTGGTLVKRHAQLFLKRYRDLIKPRKIRFYLVGEYGDENLRPHYHAIIYGHRFDDAKLSREEDGHRFFTSATLESLWGYGFVEFGEVTPETCAYVARYVQKKITGDRAQEHYQRVTFDGELVQVIPEFSTMSRRPGIGQRHYDQFKADLYPSDFVILNGHRTKMPRYYDRLLETEDPDQHARVKDSRRLRARRDKANQTDARLAVREECLRARLQPATRKL